MTEETKYLNFQGLRDAWNEYYVGVIKFKLGRDHGNLGEKYITVTSETTILFLESNHTLEVLAGSLSCF
jgi:hypothetical protein